MLYFTASAGAVLVAWFLAIKLVVARTDAGLVVASALGVATCFGLYRVWRWVGDGMTRELRHGYSTAPLTFGGLRLGRSRRFHGSGHRLPWDYSGVWVRRNGEHEWQAPTQLDADPPGYYPSPSRTGTYELWTGSTWSGEFVHPDELDRT